MKACAWNVGGVWGFVVGSMVAGAVVRDARVEGAVPPEPRFRAVDVDTKVGIGYGVTTADVDGDKKVDIVLVDKDVVAWYRNPTWEKHVIAEKLTQRDHVCIAAADVNGDGKAEIAVGAEWNPGDTQNSGAVFYLVAPADRTAKWTPVKLPHEPTVHRMRWSRDWQGRAELVVAPLHGRGNNAGTGEGVGVKILAYRFPEDPKGEWATRVLSDSRHKTHNVDLVQMDEDEADEFLIACKEGVAGVNWSMADGGMREVMLGTNELGGAGEVRAGVTGGTVRFVAAIEPMHGNTLAVYVPPATGRWERGWDRVVVDETLVDGHALACGDLIGQGRPQVVAGWRAMNRAGVKVGIRLYTALDEAGRKWRTSVVDDNAMACEDLVLADLDGDGRLDIVAAGRATKNLKVYWNETGK